MPPRLCPHQNARGHNGGHLQYDIWCSPSDNSSLARDKSRNEDWQYIDDCIEKRLEGGSGSKTRRVLSKTYLCGIRILKCRVRETGRTERTSIRLTHAVLVSRMLAKILVKASIRVAFVKVKLSLEYILRWLCASAGRRLCCSVTVEPLLVASPAIEKKSLSDTAGGSASEREPEPPASGLAMC